jgi:hypothetical protein
MDSCSLIAGCQEVILTVSSLQIDEGTIDCIRGPTSSGDVAMDSAVFPEYGNDDATPPRQTTHSFAELIPARPPTKQGVLSEEDTSRDSIIFETELPKQEVTS